MGFKQLADLDCETTIQIGGKDKKTGKSNAKTFTGHYIGSKEITTKFGPGKIHIFSTEAGNVGIWGKTDMDNKLGTVVAGSLTRVTFTGTVPSKKGNPMWKYKVEVDTNDMIDVAAQEQQPTGDQEPEAADYGDQGGDEGTDDADPEAEEQQPDEQPLPRAAAPRKPLSTPSPTRQAQVQALLKGNGARRV